LIPELYCPLGQLAHSRSAVSVPAFATYCPGWQSLHVVQLALFSCELNVPEGQPAQTASLVGLPGVSRNVPALQSCHGWQVSTLLSAL
jgi:hypothetical protein